MPNTGFNIRVVGTQGDIDRLQQAILGHEPAFQLSLESADRPRCQEDTSPDVAVISPTVEKPLIVANEIRAACPGSQILFLVQPERLTHFRASLPFVPNLGSAWTSSSTADAPTLVGLLKQAAQTARHRAATNLVIGRINQQLAKRQPQAAKIRESQLALSERYLATVLTQSPDAFIAVDQTGSVLAYNNAAVVLFGSSIETGQPAFVALLPEEERGRISDFLAHSRQGNTVTQVECRLGEDPCTERQIELSLALIPDPEGQNPTVSITARDITERKRAEERQKLMIAELNHRVKNTLTIVQALAFQTFTGKKTREEEQAAYSSRLAALASAHDLLTQQSWHSVSLDQLARRALNACGARMEQVRLTGPEVVLPPQTAVSLAMAIHELCTNAVKYGALSVTEGLVAVQWSVENARLKFFWQELGGPAVMAPEKRGFGVRMIERGLARELHGEVNLSFEPKGLVCKIAAPLPSIRAGRLHV